MGADPLTHPPAPWERFAARLFAPVDGSSLAAFRMMFGALVVLESARYFLNGWIEHHFVQPVFHFTYYGFEWVRPLRGEALHDFFAAMLLLGALLAVGLFYRAAAILAFLSISYLFLMEQALYLNHIYLFALIAGLLSVTDAHRAASLDRIRLRWQGPALVPAWQLYLLRAQVFLVYFFGGLAKLNGDWLRGEPVRTWMKARGNTPLIGPLVTQEWAAWLISYGGLLFDLGICFLLLWRPARLPALLLALAFHATNKALFNIGIFPYLAFAATLLFLDPDWPARIWERVQRARARRRTQAGPAASLEWDDEDETLDPTPEPMELVAPATPDPSAPKEAIPPWRFASRAQQRWVLAGIGAYLAIQVALPLRHWLYPGDVNWTEEGHRFSWRMKLRDKEGTFGARVRDPDTGREWRVNPAEHLADWQALEAVGRPDMLLQYAHYLRDLFRRKYGLHDAEVYVQSRCRLNDHPVQDLVDPNVNLAREERRLWPPAPWIVPPRW